MAKKPKAPTEITSIRHTRDTRVNIPTEELRDFVAEDEKAPKAILYPRDPSLDPQLVGLLPPRPALFMVFGEPDIRISASDDDGEHRLTVEVKGVDVYDPTTGQIRSSLTDDIACWFIDTDYNGESFFVRHAYFTGGDEPYEKLKRALRAEIDEGAWSTLYGTVSRPFAAPDTGKIAEGDQPRWGRSAQSLRLEVKRQKGKVQRTPRHIGSFLLFTFPF